MTVLIGIIIFSLIHLQKEQPATQSPSPKQQIEDRSKPLEVPPIKFSGKAQRKLQLSPARVINAPSNSRNPLVTSPDDPQIDQKQIQTWIKQLDSESQSERRKAFRSLSKAGPEALPAIFRLMKFLDEEDSYEKGLAIDCLGAIGPKAAEAVPNLHKILKDSDNFYLFRFKAANAMTQMGKAGEVAIPTLIDIVKNPGPSQKQRLKKETAPEARGLMAPIIRRDEKGGYTDRRDAILMGAIGSLGKYGSRARKAIPAIEEVRDDPDTLPVAKKMCKEMLEHIQETD